MLVDALRTVAGPLFPKSMNTPNTTGRQFYEANGRYRAHPSNTNREIMVNV